MRVFILVLLFLPNVLLGSDCNILSKLELYNNADLVFTGYVIESSEHEYKIWVQEVFKGNLVDTIVGVSDQNHLHPKKGTTWLIYTSELDGGSIFIDPCSGSKSFESPYGYHDISVTPPPPLEIYESPSDLYFMEQIQRSKSLNELYFEITGLREMNLKKKITENSQAIEIINVLVNKFYLIVVILGAIVFFQLIYILKIRSVK